MNLMRESEGLGEKMHYDYLIVGAGLSGSVFAHEMKKRGRSCLVIDKRDHIAGNIYTEKRLDIFVHRYGAHIFHTSDKIIWDYIGQFAEFNHYVNSPLAVYQDEIYNLPFNMNMFSKLWHVRTPAQAKVKIEEQREPHLGEEPGNLEEQALALVGREIYGKLIKGYTEKQWGRPCTELPAFLIKRLPLRFTYDNNYFNDCYQGIPVGGYTEIVKKLLAGTDVETGISWKEFQKTRGGITYDKLFYTGMIDEYFDYKFGALEYRSLHFETEELPEEENFQGNAVVNYTEREIPYTRIIEHKHFVFGKQPGTVITREYPVKWRKGDEPYYPVNDEKNCILYLAYRELAEKEDRVIFGGRLGQYRYYDMDKAIAAVLEIVKKQP